jgi:anti-sigma factor RsiW
MTACPDQLLWLQAHVDGELDAANTLLFENHLRTCSGCAEELARHEVLRDRIRSSALQTSAPAAVRERIEAMIDENHPTRPMGESGPALNSNSGRRPWFAGFASLSPAASWGGGILTGMAACLALLFIAPQITRPNTEDQLIENHVRSLSIETHLTDVATSDRHVVKPWFNGKIDFAPPVPELAARGFPLVGGRLDYIDGREVAAIVYRRRLHTINVFVQPAATLALPGGIATTRNGYSLVRWTANGLEFWAISDIELGELQSFQRAFVGQPSL